MRKEDKLKNMVNANKSFQKRFDAENSGIKEEEAFVYTHVPDIFPQLSKLLN